MCIERHAHPPPPAHSAAPADSAVHLRGLTPCHEAHARHVKLSKYSPTLSAQPRQAHNCPSLLAHLAACDKLPPVVHLFSQRCVCGSSRCLTAHVLCLHFCADWCTWRHGGCTDIPHIQIVDHASVRTVGWQYSLRHSLQYCGVLRASLSRALADLK